MDFTSAIEVKPRCVHCFVRRGQSWVYSGAPSQGIEDYNNALSLDDTSVAALYNRGIVYQYQGNSIEAVADFDRLLKVQPNHVAALHHRGQVRHGLSEYEAAVGEYNAALQINPSNVYILDDLCRALTDLGRFEEAVNIANTVLESYPEDSVAHLFRGVALQSLGKLKEALPDLNAAIEAQSKPDMVRFASFAYHRRAGLWAQMNEYDKAVADYTVLLKTKSDGPTWAGRAHCYAKLGKMNESVADLREAIKVDPGFAPAWNGLAWTLATSPDNSFRNGAEAVGMAQKACELTTFKDALHIDTLATDGCVAGYSLPDTIANGYEMTVEFSNWRLSKEIVLGLLFAFGAFL